jgi:hypothetical protein
VSDTGISSSDGITRDDTPTFTGTATQGSMVFLFALPAGLPPSGRVAIGQAVVGSDARFGITAPPLADGSYAIDAEVIGANGVSGQGRSLGTVVIDTTAPRINGVALSPRTGTVLITYHDQGSGVLSSAASNLDNYRLFRLANANTLKRVSLTTVKPGASQSYSLIVNNSRPIAKGQLILAISSAGISDAAGNVLDGEFNNNLRSGDGHPGGNFFGNFQTNGRANSNPRPVKLRTAALRKKLTSVFGPTGPPVQVDAAGAGGYPPQRLVGQV